MRTLIKSGQVAENRKARFEYSIEDTIEAGVELSGAEVKSIRFGMVNISDGFVSSDRAGNLVLKNVLVQPLPTAAKIVRFDERRGRQLLLHASQIRKLRGKLAVRGATIVPLKMYFNNRGLIKVLLGVGVGKTRSDKRQTIKQREWDKEKARLVRGKRIK
ncbi:MAG: SsrA-binding protein SmpB [Rickettsiales bacterium]|jgi:SsrA-binding protein|nr:SsrA-binding protein SmpB [Rickettsiales bacterium]